MRIFMYIKTLTAQCAGFKKNGMKGLVKSQGHLSDPFVFSFVSISISIVYVLA